MTKGSANGAGFLTLFMHTNFAVRSSALVHALGGVETPMKAARTFSCVCKRLSDKPAAISNMSLHQVVHAIFCAECVWVHSEAGRYVQTREDDMGAVWTRQVVGRHA